MDTLGERFLKARRQLRLTQREVAKRKGTIQQTVAKIENGSIKNPNDMDSYAEILGVKAEWLLYGTGEAPLWLDIKERTIPHGYSPLLEWNEIEEWVKHGTRNIDVSSDVRDFYTSPLADRTDIKNIFSVKVKNDSMTTSDAGRPSFPIGTILFCEPAGEAKSGDFILFKKRNNGGPVFRQIIEEGPTISFSPLNLRYPIQEVSDDHYLLARVLCALNILI